MPILVIGYVESIAKSAPSFEARYFEQERFFWVGLCPWDGEMRILGNTRLQIGIALGEEDLSPTCIGVMIRT